MAVGSAKPQPNIDQSPAKPWQGQSCWRLLDTQFALGERFFQTWRGWRADPQRPRLLHYVAFCQKPVSREDLLSGASQTPALLQLAQELASQWFGLLPGFHRFSLDQGQVVLTLCVGETLRLLREQSFEADAVALHLPAIDADALWIVKALARCCRRGTRLVASAPHQPALSNLASQLKQCGFGIESPVAPASAVAGALIEARFDPRWQIKKTRASAMASALPVGSCAVIGAGLAGASVAAALARRGWQVTVLDQAQAPASGASGLPVGLVVPHVSTDDCALSRLSRNGVRMMLQQARSLLVAGQDWSPSGVLERRIDGSPSLPSHWPDAGHEWSSLASATVHTAHWAGSIDTRQDLWHPHGAWLKPAQLVRAWLRQPGITFAGNAAVARLHQHHGTWDLLDAQGGTLCSAERVVLANACGAAALIKVLLQDQPARSATLRRLPAMRGMRGLLSWDLHDDPERGAFPPHPVNGSGAMVPHVPMDGRSAWFMGSSYQSALEAERSDQDNHLGNLQHLQALLPELASQLQTVFACGTLKRWKNTRCVTADRLPAVGPLEPGAQPGLWLCAGMGSRGLSFAVLCAELLAARWGAEPWPLPASLARSLDALRG